MSRLSSSRALSPDAVRGVLRAARAFASARGADAFLGVVVPRGLERAAVDPPGSSAQQARGFRGTASSSSSGGGGSSPHTPSWHRPGTPLTRDPSSAHSDFHDDPSPITPWVRSVISGVELLRNPRYNKGMAFTDEERDKMHMKGLLPPAKFAQHTQVRRVMRNVRALTSPVEQHFHLLGLLERNERLFHRVLCEHYEELLPVMYAPTVGQVCKKFSVMFNRPRGLYITCKDRGEIHRILKNWPEKRVKLVVVTDGERVMGLGDLGVQGMGVAAAKTNLYTAAGGLDPSDVLAVCLDVGTNNRELLNDPLYIGNKHERTVGEAYDELLDEFVDAVKRRFGERCVIQFEDFSNANGKRLLERYASRAAVFNDDIHGVAATALAGIIAARPKTGKGVSEHTYLIAGAGETGTGIGEMIAEYAAAETGRTVAETRRLVWMVDSKGLVTRHRAESEPDLALHKLPFAHPGDQGECLTVLEAVEAVKPTALIGVRRHKHSLRVGALATTDGGAYEGYAEDPAGGVAGVADRGALDSGAFSPPPRLFTDEVLRAMHGPHAPAPLIFALSRPEGIAECDARHAYEATEGACAFAAGCPNEPFVDRHTGKRVAVRPSTSAYVFPGMGLGLALAEATRVRSPMFHAAAEAVADLVTEEDLEEGALYPRAARAREVAAHVAARVAAKCHEMGNAAGGAPPGGKKMTHQKLVEYAKSRMWDPSYRSYM